MAHYYLNKLGISSKDFSVFNPKGLSFRERRERRKHGFAFREVIDLDYTSATWLYEHIQVYKENAEKWIVMDDPNITFNIPVMHLLPKEKWEYLPGSTELLKKVQEEVIESHTQIEAINLMIEYLEYFFLEPEDPIHDTKDILSNENMFLFSVSEIKKWDFLSCAFKIYAVIIGSMWI